MRRLSAIIVMLLLVLSAAPVLACVTSHAMNQQESACCRSMHGNCGDMAKMGCCHQEIRTGDHPQLASSAPSTEIHWIICANVAPLPAFVQSVPSAWLRTPQEHSPPGLRVATTTILRI
jgi:hypothetical protein